MNQVGDQIVWFLDPADPNSIRTGTITKVGGGVEKLVWVDHLHKPEDCIYADFTWPARVSDELASILTQRKALKKAYDDSMSLFYVLRNKISRGEV